MRICKMATCVQAVYVCEGESFPVRQAPCTADNQPHSVERDFFFVERPSQDFFCPVSLELLLEPQLTSCCGHHLSLEAATRLQREGKPCPMCNSEQWSAVLDKYHRRKVHEVRVRCWYKDNGCEWVGEVNELKQHADSCVKRPWECKYCALKCTYGEGEGKHWPTCLKFPEPCPNRCEVGSVERCNVEQHRSVCSLEPVACEMKEFGCSVVVPRKELATHMRESELQHLTAMTVLNLRLSRQLQQDSTERDRKIAQLQQEMNRKLKQMQAEMDRNIAQLQSEMKAKFEEQKGVFATVNCNVIEQKRHILELKGSFQEVQHKTQCNEQHTAAATCSGTEVFTFSYSCNKDTGCGVFSSPFYSHHRGYKFKLQVDFYPSPHNDIGAQLYLMKGDYDHQLHWPMQVKVRLELLNQAGDHHHVVRTASIKWTKFQKERAEAIDNNIIKYSTLEKRGGGVQYMMNDCLKFRIIVSIL